SVRSLELNAIEADTSQRGVLTHEVIREKSSEPGGIPPGFFNPFRTRSPGLVTNPTGAVRDELDWRQSCHVGYQVDTQPCGGSRGDPPFAQPGYRPFAPPGTRPRKPRGHHPRRKPEGRTESHWQRDSG